MVTPSEHLEAQELPTRHRGLLWRVVTDELRSVLEQRSVRFSVIVMILLSALALDGVGHGPGIDSGWMFVMAVAIAAIAGGLREGLVVALAASVLGALFSSPQMVVEDPAVAVSGAAARFALYGLTAGVLGAFAEVHYSVQSELRTLASVDPLTRVANVSSFYEELSLLLTGRTRFAVLLVDVDDLKTINDRYGHQVGSAAILTVARVLRTVVRASDCVARYGGDEFVVLLREADRSGAQVVINRTRRMLGGEPLPGAGTRVGVSVGVALWPDDGVTSEDLLAVADAAMYVDKGRDKVKS